MVDLALVWADVTVRNKMVISTNKCSFFLKTQLRIHGMSILIPELHERSKRASLRKDRDIRPQLTFHAQYRVNKRIEAAATLGPSSLSSSSPAYAVVRLLTFNTRHLINFFVFSK